jgi:uncharacterized membrane protein (UPF0136 family)
MVEQVDVPKSTKISFRDLPDGFKIIIISALLYIITLFFTWVGQKGFIGVYRTGISFMHIVISHSSGLPFFFLVTLISAILCIVLCIPFFKLQNIENKKSIPIILIVLSSIGVLPYLLLPFELREWSPPGQFLFGGWLSLLCAIGILIGAIRAFIQVKDILYFKMMEEKKEQG